MSNNPHADDCGFALYGPPALCTCRAAWRSSDGIAEIRAVAGRISDVDDHVTVHQAADEIERLRAELVEERHTVLEIVRSQDEFGEPHGSPWRVAPWGDGSSDTGNSNIISDRWQVVIASEMPTETAEFIVASVNQIERLRAAAPLYQEALQRADLLIRTLPQNGAQWSAIFHYNASADEARAALSPLPAPKEPK